MSDNRPEAPPQFSPDGRYWWDGESWIRVEDLHTDVPPLEVHPPGAPGQGPVDRRRGLIAVAAALVVIVVIVAAAAYLHVIPGFGPAPRPSPSAVASPAATPPASDVDGAYDNAGVSDDSAHAAADFDGYGFSYSAEGLANAGALPARPLHVAGMTFIWPSAPPGRADNVVARGQTIQMRKLRRAARVGILGSSTGGAAHGEATLNYSDGTSSHLDLGLSDWTLNSGTSPISYGNVPALRMTYRNCSCGLQKIATYVFLATLPVDPAKTLTSIQLPAPAGSALMHVFSIGVSTTPLKGPVIRSLATASASPGQQVTIIGSGFEPNQTTGYVTLIDQGTTWANPNSPHPLVVDSWSETRITFTVPTADASKGAAHVLEGTAATVGVVTSTGASSNLAVLEIVAHR